ncbi:MAG: cytochrome c [Flavobacteriales bacterium]|nr:cytochrome c [Flavobacteriales bacterium]
MNRYTNTIKFGLSLIVLGLVSCSKDPNSPGYEYMPDMYRSPSVEAYVDYPDFGNPDVQSARVPAKGTIPYSENESKAVFNFPYPFAPANADQEAEMYEKSVVVKNPVIINMENKDVILAEGQKIYEQFCIHCHGEKGDGQGTIVQNGKISGVPDYKSANLMALPEGKMFHTISYGKGIMGSHAGQINKEERWKVIHYIKSLQNDGNYPVENAAVVADSTKTNQ